MTTELRRKREYLQNIQDYLAELELLLRRRVQREELLSLAETDELAMKGPNRESTPRSRATLDFSALSQASFRRAVSELGVRNGSGVYIWTPRTRACGVLPPVSLAQIDFGFPFDLNVDGVLKLVCANFADSLLIELEKHGAQPTVELELTGPAWGDYLFREPTPKH